MDKADAYRQGLGGADFEVARVTQFLRLPDDATSSPWPRKVRYYSRRAQALGVTVRPMATEEVRSTRERSETVE